MYFRIHIETLLNIAIIQNGRRLTLCSVFSPVVEQKMWLTLNIGHDF